MIQDEFKRNRYKTGVILNLYCKHRTEPFRVGGLNLWKSWLASAEGQGAFEGSRPNWPKKKAAEVTMPPNNTGTCKLHTLHWIYRLCSIPNESLLVYSLCFNAFTGLSRWSKHLHVIHVMQKSIRRDIVQQRKGKRGKTRRWCWSNASRDDSGSKDMEPWTGQTLRRWSKCHDASRTCVWYACHCIIYNCYIVVILYT